MMQQPLGNHEFNYGLDFLDEVLDDAPMPYVSANVYKDDHDNNLSNDEHYFKPYTIIKEESTRRQWKNASD